MDIKTTTDLKALRLLLGLQPSEAAMLIGETKDWLISAERGRSWNISPRYRDALLGWEASVRDFIAWVGVADVRYIIAYPNDDVFREYDPEWSARIPTSLMHLQACARAVADLPDRMLNIVTLVPSAYQEYLNRDPGGRVFPDNQDSRQLWAEAYCKNYRVMGAKDA